jgi:hypothetical protein
MGIFTTKRRPLDPLIVDPLVANADVGAQDDDPGPNALDFETIEHREAAEDANRHALGRGGGARVYGEPHTFPGSRRDPVADND